jgi:hypothetical protein
MDETAELVNLLVEHGWRQEESGEYVRGRYYVALMPRGVIHVGQRASASARPDTNRWGQSRTLAEAIAWVQEKSREDA